MTLLFCLSISQNTQNRNRFFTHLTLCNFYFSCRSRVTYDPICAKKENGLPFSLFMLGFFARLENECEANRFVFHFERDPFAVRIDAIDVAGSGGCGHADHDRAVRVNFVPVHVE